MSVICDEERERETANRTPKRQGLARRVVTLTVSVLYFDRLVKVRRHFSQNTPFHQHPADGLVAAPRLPEGVPQLFGLPIALDAYKIRQLRLMPPDAPAPTSPRILRAANGTLEQYFLNR